MEAIGSILWQVLVPLIIMAVGLIVTMVFKRLLGDWKDKAVYAEALEALQEGIDAAQEDFVVWRKRAAADGKLTAMERRQAMKLAWSHTKDVATGPAGELVLSWGWGRVQSLIKQLLAKRDNGKAKVKVDVNASKVVEPAAAGAGGDADRAAAESAENEG